MTDKDLDDLLRLEEQANEINRQAKPVSDALADYNRAVSARPAETGRAALAGLEATYFEDLRRLREQVVAASGSQVAEISQQVREAFAAYNAQVAEMSRGILDAVNSQMASILVPRIEIFRPTLEPLIANIEVPYYPQPPSTPAPETPVSPTDAPAVPAGERDILDQVLVGVLVSVFNTILVYAIQVYAQTGIWVFDELLTYFVEQLNRSN